MGSAGGSFGFEGYGLDLRVDVSTLSGFRIQGPGLHDLSVL